MMGYDCPLNVGLIGLGKHAQQVLLPAVEQLPDVLLLTSLATAHAETARAASARYRLPCHVGHEALIADPNLQAVIIASLDHETCAIAALEAGKHVFSETPGISSVAGARRIRELCRKRNLIYQVGSCLRWAPPYQKLQQLLEDWRSAEPGSRTFCASYYGAVSHIYNLFLFLNGDIESLLALRALDGSAHIVLCRFANGDVGSVRVANFHNWSPPNEAVEVTHATGKLVAEDGRLVRFHRTPARAAVSAMALSFDHADGQLFHSTYSLPYGGNSQLYMRGYIPELADFVDCVRTGKPPRCGVDDAEKTLMVNQAVRNSMDSGACWTNVKTGSWAEKPIAPIES